MNCYIEAGWLICPYAGQELVRIEIEVNGRRFPAFLDYDIRGRVAKIRHVPDRTATVRLLAGGAVLGVGKVYIK